MNDDKNLNDFYKHETKSDVKEFAHKIHVEIENEHHHNHIEKVRPRRVYVPNSINSEIDLSKLHTKVLLMSELSTPGEIQQLNDQIPYQVLINMILTNNNHQRVYMCLDILCLATGALQFPQDILYESTFLNYLFELLNFVPEEIDPNSIFVQDKGSKLISPIFKLLTNFIRSTPELHLNFIENGLLDIIENNLGDSTSFALLEMIANVCDLQFLPRIYLCIIQGFNFANINATKRAIATIIVILSRIQENSLFDLDPVYNIVKQLISNGIPEVQKNVLQLCLLLPQPPDIFFQLCTIIEDLSKFSVFSDVFNVFCQFNQIWKPIMPIEVIANIIKIYELADYKTGFMLAKVLSLYIIPGMSEDNDICAVDIFSSYLGDPNSGYLCLTTFLEIIVYYQNATSDISRFIPFIAESLNALQSLSEQPQTPEMAAVIELYYSLVPASITLTNS